MYVMYVGTYLLNSPRFVVVRVGGWDVHVHVHVHAGWVEICAFDRCISLIKLVFGTIGDMGWIGIGD